MPIIYNTFTKIIIVLSGLFTIGFIAGVFWLFPLNSAIADDVPPLYVQDVNKSYLDSIYPNKLNYISEVSDKINPIVSLNGIKEPYFYIKKYYKNDNFNLHIRKKVDPNLYPNNQYGDFFMTGIYNEEYDDYSKELIIEVEDYILLESNLYKMQSKTFKMIQDQKYKTLGYFEVGEFYLQIKDKQDYIVLNIFYADNEKDLHYLKNVLK